MHTALWHIGRQCDDKEIRWVNNLSAWVMGSRSDPSQNSEHRSTRMSAVPCDMSWGVAVSRSLVKIETAFGMAHLSFLTSSERVSLSLRTISSCCGKTPNCYEWQRMKAYGHLNYQKHYFTILYKSSRILLSWPYMENFLRDNHEKDYVTYNKSKKRKLFFKLEHFSSMIDKSYLFWKLTKTSRQSYVWRIKCKELEILHERLTGPWTNRRLTAGIVISFERASLAK